MIFGVEHVWTAPAPAVALFALLADADRYDRYDRWWPQVRRVRRVDAATGVTVIRSLLPMPLRVVVEKEVADPTAGLLRAGLGGDVVGWSSWQVEDGAARYEQECSLGDPLPARAAVLPGGEAVLRADHAWMMLRGEQALAGS